MAENDRKFTNGAVAPFATDPEVGSRHDEAEISLNSFMVKIVDRLDRIDARLEKLDRIDARLEKLERNYARLGNLEQHFANFFTYSSTPVFLDYTPSEDSVDDSDLPTPVFLDYTPSEDSVDDSCLSTPSSANASALRVPTDTAPDTTGPKRSKEDFGHNENPFAGRLPDDLIDRSVPELIDWIDSCTDLVREAEINNTEAKLKYQLNASFAPYVRRHNPDVKFDPNLRVSEYFAQARLALMDSPKMFNHYITAIVVRPLQQAMLYNHTWFNDFSITLTKLLDDIRYMSPTKVHAIGTRLFAHRFSLSTDLRIELLEASAFFSDCNMQPQETVSARAPKMIMSVVNAVSTIRNNLPRKSYSNNSYGDNSYGNW